MTSSHASLRQLSRCVELSNPRTLKPYKFQFISIFHDFIPYSSPYLALFRDHGYPPWALQRNTAMHALPRNADICTIRLRKPK